nr:MAG TPA: hypothetical protein [Caudoviricetes sp.]
MVKILNSKEEFDFLNDFAVAFGNAHELFISTGSSRAVFEMPNGLAAKYAPLWGRKPAELASCVVKLSLGVGGFVQAQNEINTYVAYEKELPLAKIYAYGQYVEIREWVETEPDNIDVWTLKDDYDHEPERFAIASNRQRILDEAVVGHSISWMTEKDYHRLEDDDFGWDEYENVYKFIIQHVSHDLRESLESDYQNACDVFAAIDDLNSYLGDTSDNCQIGRTAEGCWVSYDYGFRGDNWGDNHSWGSPIANAIDDPEVCSDYLLNLCGILEEAIEVQQSIDAVLTCQDRFQAEKDFCVEHNFGSYYCNHQQKVNENGSYIEDNDNNASNSSDASDED